MIAPDRTSVGTPWIAVCCRWRKLHLHWTPHTKKRFCLFAVCITVLTSYSRCQVVLFTSMRVLIPSLLCFFFVSFFFLMCLLLSSSGRRQQSGRNFQKIKRGMDDSSVRKDPPEKKNSYANAGFEHVEGGKRINGSSGLTESNHQPRRSVGKLERREQSSDESASCWTKFRRNAWLIPLVYSEFWIAATFSLITAFFPILVSGFVFLIWMFWW